MNQQPCAADPGGVDKRYQSGIVAGKFYPPHAGHHLLIDTALSSCEHVDVLVVDNPEYRIDAATRAAWLRAAHPAAHIHIIADIGLDDDSRAWAAHAMQFLRYKPDVVFSSEAYGPTWAHYMGAEHVMVDHNRDQHQISGTQVRADIFGNWRRLHPAVRAGLAARIVVVGAESTGTTTLAQALANRLRVPWVPEIGRDYTYSMQSFFPEQAQGYQWTDEDFHRIGRLQQQYEREVAAASDGVIVCDTNAWATTLWQRRYLGYTTDEMRTIAADCRADLYILTGDEIPFVQDGIRDGEHIRHDMHQWFLAELSAMATPMIQVRGSVEERIAAVLPMVEQAIAAAGRIIG
ncbi:MAG: AAA family ATPase [Corynebacterium sp.]|uniref:AAA family ATPase n=1 Tax=Corynebacterium sp. TaxID=1720 RepID=UPI0026DD7C7F|nr:AAA family ATPase [Corynebacterium sp.]MDO5099622.1 AAA family ATPase [Corynebacterium sp.]